MTQVTIVMGSASDKPTANKAEKILDKFGIKYETFVASAHRTPDRVVDIIKKSEADVFIALAGLSAALPGVVAAHTLKPVIGVPCASSSSPANLDSLLSVVQMPPGVPVAGVGIGRGENAALLAARIIGTSNKKIATSLEDYRKELEQKTIDSN